MNKYHYPMICIFFIFCYVTGPSCPKGMTSLYGKCVGIVKNTESNAGTNDNCKWKSDNPNFELASFGSETVSDKLN